MAHLQLQAQTRTKVGHTAKQLLRTGQLPAVVYSKAFPARSIQIDYKQFYHLYKEVGKTGVVDLTIDEGKVIPCIVHDLDIHPFKDIPRHVDFLVVNLKEKITAPVPIEVVGEAPATKTYGAVLNIVHDELEVTALPDKLPESIVINIDTLIEMSDVITIGDLASQAVDFEFVDVHDMPIVSLTQPKEADDSGDMGSATGGLDTTTENTDTATDTK